MSSLYFSNQSVAGMTNNVKMVEATRPKISDQPRPEKIGSSKIGIAYSMAAQAVSRIGRRRTARLSEQQPVVPDGQLHEIYLT